MSTSLTALRSETRLFRDMLPDRLTDGQKHEALRRSQASGTMRGEGERLEPDRG